MQELEMAKVNENMFACDNCIKVRSRKTGHVKEKLCITSLVSVSVFSLSVSVFVLYSHLSMQNKLHETESALSTLRRDFDTLAMRYKTIEKGDKHSATEKTQIENVNTELLDFKDSGSYMLSNTKTPYNDLRSRAKRSDEKKKKRTNKPNNKRRKGSKKCRNCLPAVQIEGQGGPKYDSDKTAVGGFWSVPLADQFTSSVYDFRTVGKDGKVKVKKSGLYLVYAQLNLIGRSKEGFTIIRGFPDGNETILGTFEGIGASDVNHHQTCFTMRIANLEENDVIFIREVQHNSGITLTGASKRGYHVKKETAPNNETILFTCTGYTNDEAEYVYKACSSLKLVKLEQNDFIFIQEIDGNTGGLYSKSASYFGMIRIGD